MNDLWTLLLPRATRIAVQVAWQPSEQRGLVWTGIASAVDPLVALALVASGTTTEWSKTDDRDVAELPMSLSIMVSESWGYRGYAHFHLGGASPSRSGAQLNAACALDPSSDAPAAPDARSVETGRTIILATFGTPPVHVGALFLARRDVQFVRKGIWRVRPPLLEGVDQSIATILTYRRVGRVTSGNGLTSAR